MDPYNGEFSLPAALREVEGLSAERAEAALAVCLPPGRRCLCWTAASWASWRRPCRREEERGCGEQRPGRRTWKTGEGMRKRREGGGSSHCWSATLSSLWKKMSKNLNHKDKKKKKSLDCEVIRAGAQYLGAVWRMA